MVAKKIKLMKDNKSPGVDIIPPKLLMETVLEYNIVDVVILKKSKSFLRCVNG